MIAIFADKYVIYNRTNDIGRGFVTSVFSIVFEKTKN